MRGPEKGRIHLQFKNITLSLCRQWISLPYPIKKSSQTRKSATTWRRERDDAACSARVIRPCGIAAADFAAADMPPAYLLFRRSPTLGSNSHTKTKAPTLPTKSKPNEVGSIWKGGATK